MKKLTLVIIMFGLITSCMTTKTSVGEYREIQGEEYNYAKGKQLWILWGIIPIGRTNVNTPKDGNCEVITKFRFSDVLITCFTFGFVKSYSIKIKAKRVPQILPVQTETIKQ